MRLCSEWEWHLKVFGSEWTSKLPLIFAQEARPPPSRHSHQLGVACQSMSMLRGSASYMYVTVPDFEAV